MKKAKLFLTAVTVLAVVGGALAFKANKGTTPLYIETTPGSGVCDNYVGLYAEDLSQTPIQAKFTTAGTCQSLQVTSVN
jgi:hypothetical protein